MTAKSNYLAAMRKLLDDLNATITEYEIKVNRSHGEAQLIFRDSLFKLRQEWMLMCDKLESMRESDACDWDKFTHETDRLCDACHDAYDTYRIRSQSRVARH